MITTVAMSAAYVAERYTPSRTTPSWASIATRITRNIWVRIKSRWVMSAAWKRLANMVVSIQIHHSDTNTATTHAILTGLWRCDTAVLITRIAATNTRS